MKTILVDSGPLIALFDADDKYYLVSVDFIKRNKKTFGNGSSEHNRSCICFGLFKTLRHHFKNGFR